MGRYTRPGTQITDFRPDDTDTEMYIPSAFGTSLSELLERAKVKWPTATLDNIEITSEKIHTECLGYDRYDAGDYTDYIILNFKG